LKAKKMLRKFQSFRNFNFRTNPLTVGRRALSQAAAPSAAGVASADVPTPPLPLSTAEFRKLHHIKLSGIGAEEYAPYATFDDTPFAPKLKQAMTKAGYTKPTATQAQVAKPPNLYR